MDKDTIEKRLSELPDWHLVDGGLERKLVFKNFTLAFAFMTKVAAAAEQMNHHPDWSNSYNRVAIRLTSHEAGGVTERDFELAERISELATG